MILLVLTNPEKVLVKFPKLLKDGPFPCIFRVVLGNFDDRIDHFHYELSIITVIMKIIFLAITKFQRDEVT